jgi:hypothetical protein
MRFPLGEMTVGDVLDRGLKLLFARLPTFYIINLIVLTPLILVQIVIPFIAQGIGDGDNVGPAAAGKLLASLGVLLIAVVVTVILQPIATAAILHIVMQEYVGNKARLGEAFSFALSRFLTLLLASILVGLIVFVGMLCCCIPGIYFAISYAFVSQVIVLEKLGVGEGLQRSYNLISGYRWRVFGVLLLIVFAAWVVQLGLALGLQAVLPAQELIPTEKGGFRQEINPVNHIIDTVITQLAQILFTTFMAVCTTLLYLDLRIRKEGFDLELATQLGVEPTERYDDEEDRERDDDRDRDDERDWEDEDDDDRPRPPRDRR